MRPAVAIIAHEHLDAPVVTGQPDRHARPPGVAEHVGQRFLHEPVGRGLDRGWDVFAARRPDELECHVDTGVLEALNQGG